MEEDYVMIPGSGTKMIIRDVKKEIETAFLDYSMSVIVARALPDVRDGLKPVHRRILYTMHERGNDPSHPYRKSADTVGAVLGSYHPHGDASVYDAMVRLAQDFSLRYPLVDGQGNFGSVDGDPPAAYRYTEARMSRMAVEMLTDIDKDTINWDPNFDETKKEPSVLPCRFPNLLVNGSQGIAVGMATNIPPHNLSEVIDGCVAYIENPDIDLPGLMEHIKGPDFPTAGIIMGRSGIRAAYATGRGKITLRGRATIEETKNGRTQIIITEIPYMVNKARLIENMAELVKDKRIEGITGLNDETNRKGMRIVVDIRKDANAQVILNQLYQYTQLQDTVGVIMLAIDHKVPKVMTLKQMIQKYVEFQDEVVRRRTQYDLKKAKERAHILEGLKKATDIVDELIATIRACKGGMAEAKAAIMEQFGFDDPQADAIVKLQLGRLAGLEILKIEEELSGLQAKIEDWEDILANDARLLEIVKTTPKEDYQKVILTEKSWPIFYHLSPERENILDWYEWKDDASVFEVGAGCGAISGVLCRNAKRVVANDLSKRRSTINAYKNQDASNLEIMVGNFNVVAEKMEERFDYVTLIGVLEYAKSYIGKDNPYPEYLEKINRLLKPGGKILIAIENRLGLKYFAGCREDHVGREFVGIEGYPGIDFVETFSKPELEQMLQENGFSKFKFYYPYPDYKFPAVIYSDEYLPKPGELRKNQRNFDADRITLFDEGKAFDGILKSGLFPVFSNSFLIEVEKKE